MAIKCGFNVAERKLIDQRYSSLRVKKEEEWVRLEREKCENSFAYFIKTFWPYMGGGEEYIHGWHIDDICAHLEACFRGDISNIIINIPFRMSKTILCSIAFPAQVWTKAPNKSFLCCSYSERLATDASLKCRNLIMSPLYQKFWGHKFQLSKDNNNKTNFTNDKFGERISSSVGGTNTGFGADFIIIDDPNNATDGESEAIRESTNTWWSTTMPSRVKNFNKVCKIIIQQRIHTRDLTGYILEGKPKNLVYFRLPMEFEPWDRCKTIVLPHTGGQVWCDPRTKEGELLCPARINTEVLEELKAQLRSEYVISGQLQQRPSPSSGGIYKRDWFKIFKQAELPRFDFVIQSWDTALSTKDGACYSACITLGIFEDENYIPQIMLIHSWSGRVEYPELRRRAQRFYMNCYDVDLDEDPWPGIKSHMVLIEGKANGDSLLQDLHHSGIPVHRFNPNAVGDKLKRARIASGLVESGRFFIPGIPPNYENVFKFGDKFINACATFPNNESNDIVDALSQAIIYIQDRGFVENSRNLIIPEIPEIDRTPLY